MECDNEDSSRSLYQRITRRDEMKRSDKSRGKVRTTINDMKLLFMMMRIQ
jgi:hypothetical protein